MHMYLEVENLPLEDVRRVISTTQYLRDLGEFDSELIIICTRDAITQNQWGVLIVLEPIKDEKTGVKEYTLISASIARSNTDEPVSVLH